VSIDHALALVGPLSKTWSVYLRIEADKHGRSLPGERVSSEAEAKIRAARLLEKAGMAEVEQYRTPFGLEYVIKRSRQRRQIKSQVGLADAGRPDDLGVAALT
jgi:hypothetical protein